MNERLDRVLAAALEDMEAAGTRKGPEAVIAGVIPAEGERGPRTLLEGAGERPFLRMNANGYLGMAMRPEVIAALRGTQLFIEGDET